MNKSVETSANRVSLDIDEKIFPRQVVLAAAYHFLDDYYVQLQRADQDRIKVKLKGKQKLDESGLEALAGEFENEVLHQMVRNLVAKQTDGLREVIVGRALLSAEPLAENESPDEDSTEGEPDYLDDPLGIAVPWEEKYGDEDD